MPWEHGLQEFKVMIKKDEIFKIGIFNKPHGVKGEVSFTFTDDIFDRVDCEYLVCLLDGIFVPFFGEAGGSGYGRKSSYVYECGSLFSKEICRAG